MDQFEALDEILREQNPVSSKASSFVPDSPKKSSFIREKNSEGFLQSAIKNIGALIPQSGQELGDVGRMAFRQIPMARGGEVSPMTMGPFGAGLNMAGVDRVTGIPLQTSWGNVMESQVVDPSVLLSGGALGLKRLGQFGVNKLFNVDAAKAALESTARTGAGKMSGLSSEIGSQANKQFGSTIQSLQDSGIGEQHIHSMLDDLARELDASGSTFNQPGSPANQILKLKGQVSPNNFTGPQLQVRLTQLKDALGQIGSKAQGAFTPVMKQALEQIPGGQVMRVAQEGLASAHNIQEAIDPFTRPGSLKAIANPSKYTPKEVGQFKDVEKYVNPQGNLIDSLIKATKNVKGTQFANKAAKVVGTTGAVGGASMLGIDAITKAIRSLGGLMQ